MDYRDSWMNRHPGTTVILAIICLVYIAELILAAVDGNVHSVLLEGVPTDTVREWFKYGRGHENREVTLLSSIFAHGRWYDHFLGNLALVAVFGPAIERWLGGARHFVLFAVLGMVTNVVQAGAGQAPMWGASGVVFAYAAYWPIAGYCSNFGTSLALTPKNVIKGTVRVLIFLTFFAAAFRFVVEGPTRGSSTLAHASGWVLGAGLGVTNRLRDLSPLG